VGGPDPTQKVDAKSRRSMGIVAAKARRHGEAIAELDGLT
jgi:hypothetical protein